MEKSKCCRCENKSYTYCSTCIEDSNFKPTCTYEEWKQIRKKESRKNSGKFRKTR